MTSFSKGAGGSPDPHDRVVSAPELPWPTLATWLIREHARPLYIGSVTSPLRVCLTGPNGELVADVTRPGFGFVHSRIPVDAETLPDLLRTHLRVDSSAQLLLLESSARRTSTLHKSAVRAPHGLEQPDIANRHHAAETTLIEDLVGDDLRSRLSELRNQLPPR
jgi:hypothetical protein